MKCLAWPPQLVQIFDIAEKTIVHLREIRIPPEEKVFGRDLWYLCGSDHAQMV